MAAARCWCASCRKWPETLSAARPGSRKPEHLGSLRCTPSGIQHPGNWWNWNTQPCTITTKVVLANEKNNTHFISAHFVQKYASLNNIYVQLSGDLFSSAVIIDAEDVDPIHLLYLYSSDNIWGESRSPRRCLNYCVHHKCQQSAQIGGVYHAATN